MTSEWKKTSLGIRGSGKAGKIQVQFMHWVQLMQVNVSENTIPLAYEMSSGRQSSKQQILSNHNRLVYSPAQNPSFPFRLLCINLKMDQIKTKGMGSIHRC